VELCWPFWAANLFQPILVQRLLNIWLLLAVAVAGVQQIVSTPVVVVRVVI
jgi:hypothetical protein